MGGVEESEDALRKSITSCWRVRAYEDPDAPYFRGFQALIVRRWGVTVVIPTSKVARSKTLESLESNTAKFAREVVGLDNRSKRPDRAWDRIRMQDPAS